MGDTLTPRKHRDPQRWVVFGAICLVYFFVYFHRVSTSVIVNDLLNAFQTNATALGLMSSMYFYLYAFEQPLVGYLSDRLGPRRVIGYWSIMAAAGCFIFGLAPTIGWASAGRALIGLGVGGVYVPAVKALSLWFDKKEFVAMIGLLMSVGNLGAVIATSPLAFAADTWGFRPTFFLIGGITLLLALLNLLLTRDHPGTAQQAPQKEAHRATEDRLGAWQVLASAQFWIMACLFFGIYGTLLTLQGLWATPYLMTVLAVTRDSASKLNMLIPVGVMIGAPLFGWLTSRFSLDKRRLLIMIIGLYCLTWAGMIFLYAPLGKAGMGALQMMMGVVAGGFVSLLWAIIRDATPSRMLGLTSGMLNPAPFFGVAALQVVTGAILDKAGNVDALYTISGFKNAFSVCLLVNLVCLALSFLIRTTQPE